MAEHLSTGLRDVLIAAFAGQYGSGAVRLYQSTGTPPATSEAAVNGSLIADIPLPASPFTAASSGAVSKNGTWEDSSADATGTPDYGRIVATGDTGGAVASEVRLQFSVGGPASGADLELDSATVTAAQVVAISSATATQAAA